MLTVTSDEKLNEYLNNEILNGEYFSEEYQVKCTDALHNAKNDIDKIYLNYFLVLNAAKQIKDADEYIEGARIANLFSQGFRAQCEIVSLMKPEMGEEVAYLYDRVVVSNSEALMRLNNVLGMISSEIQQHRILTGVAHKDLLFLESLHIAAVEVELEYILEHTYFDYQVEKAQSLLNEMTSLVEQFKLAGADISEDEDLQKIQSILKNAIDTKAVLDGDKFLTYYQILTATNFHTIKDSDAFKKINEFGPIMSERDYYKSVEFTRELLSSIANVLKIENSKEQSLANPVAFLQDGELVSQVETAGPQFLNLIFILSEVVGSSAYLESEKHLKGEMFDQIRYDYFSATILTILFYLATYEVKNDLKNKPTN